uniref:MBG domain-containing protein n=1 Tax=Algoriphagus sp. TaxID=1872435 RepID=UPI0040486508
MRFCIKILFICFALISVDAFGQIPQTNNLISYYPFLGNLVDESGQNHDTGVVNGNPSLTQNRFGVLNAAYYLDGVDDYLYFGNSVYSDLPDSDADGYYEDSFSISIWAKSSVVDTENFIAFGETDGLYTGMVSRIGANIEFNSSNWGFYRTSTSGKKSDDTWHQYTYVYSTGSFRKLYIDGVQVQQHYDTSKRFNFKNYGLSVGVGRFNSAGIPEGLSTTTYTGSIDDIRVWNVALSDTEVANLYSHESNSSNDFTPGPYTIYLDGPASVQAGNTSPNITLTIKDSNGNPINVSSNTIFSLSTSDELATATFTPSTVTVSAGSSSATFTYANTNVGDGTHTLTVTRSSGDTFTGSGMASLNITVTAKAVSTLTIDPIANQTYTGSAITPGVVVKDGSTTLTETTDYTIAYSDNTNVGTATITITGAGNYTGTTTQTFAIAAKAASTLTIDPIANQTYTGSAFTPGVVVKDGSTTLTETTDYTIAYTDNTNVGTATITITGAGNYTGTTTQTFVIAAKAASTLTIDPIANQTYTGSAITPGVVVKDGSTTLTETTDYTIAYTDNTNVGTATITITGAGNYTGTTTQTFAIVAKAASTLTIDPIANQTYTGSAITPGVVVKDGSTTLTETTDYTIAYTDNTNAGTATITITGAGNYTGTKTQTFAIAAKAASTLTIDPIANQTYTGSAITPGVVVKDGSTTLTETTDYTIAYTDNTNVGTATITITGAGNYTGTTTQTFAIVAKAASTLTIDPIVNQTYTGSAITPGVVVKDGSTTLTETTDYTIAYTDNTNAGTATVTITGAGNYSGTKTQTFTIAAKAASSLTIDAIANQTYSGAALTPGVVVKDGSTTLTETTDYTIAYTDNTNAGTATVTITGAGNYSGTKTQTFAIQPKVLTIRAVNATKIYGDANPSLSFTYSGLVDGDTEIDQAPSISTTATTTSGVGTYRIILTGGSDSNYTLTRVEGVVEVTPASLSLKVNSATKIYGQADPVYTYSLQGLKGADTEGILSGALTREAGEELGTYRISAGTISAGTNYTLSVTDANLQIIKARALSVADLGLITTDWSKEVALPATVNVLTTHGQYFRVEVKWDKSTLNLLARGTYSLNGTLVLPAGIENPDQVLAKAEVLVLPKEAPLDFTLKNSNFVGSTSTYFIPVGAFVVDDPVDNIHVVSLLGDGYDNKFFSITDNVLYWNSAERAPGKVTFSIVVRVTDRDGNTLDKFFTINRTRKDFGSLTITNAFSPNGDGSNDAWGVPDLRFYEGVRIQIFDKGGERVFYTENPDIRWDGTFEGKQMPVGTYYWAIEVIETGEMRRGMLNLIRK